jgi:hypothetical protein
VEIEHAEKKKDRDGEMRCPVMSDDKFCLPILTLELTS